MWLSGLLWGQLGTVSSVGWPGMYIPSPRSVGRRCDVPPAGGCDSRRSCKLACLDDLRQGTADFAAFPLIKCEGDWGKEQQASLGALGRVAVVDCEVQTESESSPVWGEEALLDLLLK